MMIVITNRVASSMLLIGVTSAFGIPLLLRSVSATAQSHTSVMVGLLLLIVVTLAFGIPSLLRNMVRPNIFVMAGLLLLIGAASAFMVPILLRNNVSATVRPNLLVMMAIVFILDVGYRKLSVAGHPVRPRGGGQIYYIPLWVWAMSIFGFAYFVPSAL